MPKHKQKILVTGGAGYIGSHTIALLIEAGYEVISVDNFSNSIPAVFAAIKKITGISVKNYAVDLCDKEKLSKTLSKEKNITAIIHFAAHKSVPESVKEPLKYYRNNILSLVHMLAFARERRIKQVIFSSSCAVYGTDNKLPITEQAIVGVPSSPYAATKQIGEQILADVAKTDKGMHAIALRYFNPLGAHPSGLLSGTISTKEGVLAGLLATTKGKKPFHIFGDDYKTRDGSAIRDYVHVVDIACAHVLALKQTGQKTAKAFDVINLGTGKGVTVFELVHAFEKVLGHAITKVVSKRREGDIPAMYANNQKAKKLLGWKTEFDLDDMLRSSFPK